MKLKIAVKIIICFAFTYSYGQDVNINGIATTVDSYTSQDSGVFEIQGNGSTIRLTGNAWKKIFLDYTITPNTILEVEMLVLGLGEIQGIMFDNDNSLEGDDPQHLFQFAGTQDYGLPDFHTYSGSDWVSYSIPIGQFFTGTYTYLVFVGDNDANPSEQESFFKNIKIFEPGENIWEFNGLDTFYNSGNVGIGTSNIPSAYKLAVNGKIISEEVKVQLQSQWPDYVFVKNYSLPSLEEVAKHIKEKGRLINIPSAKEVEVNGIELGEMNKLLLEKIEELTLYILEQEKRIIVLENKK